jgi:hypothetical protein
VHSSRTIIPSSLRAAVLELTHEGHPRIVRMKWRCREAVRWPDIDGDIESSVRDCAACIVSGKSARPVTGPLQPVPLPSRSWRKLALDFAGQFNAAPAHQGYLLVAMDYYTKWPEVAATAPGFGLPLTPISTDQPTLSTLSVTLDTDASVHSGVATVVDDSERSKPAMKTDILKFWSGSESPFDVPLPVRMKKITSSTEATRTPTVRLHASSQQQNTSDCKGDVSQTIPRMRFEEHDDIALPSSEYRVDYGRLSSSLEHPLPQKGDLADHAGCYDINVAESPYESGWLDTVGYGHTLQHHYYTNINHYDGRGSRTEGIVPLSLAIDEAAERFPSTKPYRITDVSSTAEFIPGCSHVESSRKNQRWTHEYAMSATGLEYREADSASAMNKNCIGTHSNCR